MRITPYHNLRRTGAAPTELISLAEAKAFLRVDHSHDDNLIAKIIEAVRLYAEDQLGRSVVTQQWTVDYRQSLASEVVLPMPPVQAVQAITLTDRGGEVTSVTSDRYLLLTPRCLQMDMPLCANLIQVVYNAGEDALQTAPLIQAMQSHIAVCYQHRSLSAPLPPQARGLYLNRQEPRL